MCGIAGFWTAEATGPERVDGLTRALRRMIPRGPDQQGMVAWGRPPAAAQRLALGERPAGALSAGIGACRLAIQDLSPAGDQPLLSADGRLALVFNGEIYNFVELRAELEALGRTFAGGSDGEVLLAALDQWGVACLTRLTGMFAFALVDTRRQTLLLGRDFFGIKPLYYSNWNGFSFASQVGALLEVSNAPRDVDDGHLRQYLATGYPETDEGTLFRHVRPLPPGHTLTLCLTSGRAALERYWSLTLGEAVDLPFAEAVSRLRAMFLRSMELHLRSDVPVASALSGGIDSSSIVAAVRHFRGPQEPIHAFTFVADEVPETNEEPFAREVAGHCRAEMHRVRLRTGELPERFDAFVDAQDLPFSSPVVFAQYQVFEAVKAAGFKVMLSGQGPDEFLAGYHTAIAQRMASLARRGRVIGALSLLRRAVADSPVGVRDLARPAAALAAPAWLRRIIRRARGPLPQPAFVDPQWWADAPVPPAPPESCGRDLLRELLREGVVISPLPLMLRVEDRNSMAWSVENRLPFLERELVEFVLSLPEPYLVSPGGVTKHVFREAMRGLTPPAILARRDKMGFPVPISSWLRQVRPFAESTLAALDGARPFRTAALRHLLDEVAPGRSEFSAGAFTAWRLVFLAGWARVFQARFA